MEQVVTRVDVDGCAYLCLNRPEKLNALNIEVFSQLLEHIENIENDTENIGLIILRGSGKCFSAGHDLLSIELGEAPKKAHLQSYTIERLANLPQPVIVAVHGVCYTGGLELALAGDLIVASESARFADTHAKWGLTPIWGLSQRLPRRVGPSKAREMMFTCRSYSGREAQTMGLVDSCVADECFETHLETTAKEILSQSWFSHRANKRLIRFTDGMNIDQGLSYEIHRTEGRDAKMQNRIANFNKKNLA